MINVEQACFTAIEFWANSAAANERKKFSLVLAGAKVTKRMLEHCVEIMTKKLFSQFRFILLCIPSSHGNNFNQEGAEVINKTEVSDTLAPV